MNIGIDTHGLDQPDERPEPTPAEQRRMATIEEKIWELVSEYERISGEKPYIPGFVQAKWAGV